MKPLSSATSVRTLTPTSDVAAQNASSGTQQQQLTPQSYALAVQQFSKLRTGIGQNHETLAQYLSALLDRIDGQYSQSSNESKFVALYEFSSPHTTSTPGSTLQISSACTTGTVEQWTLKPATSFRSGQEYGEYNGPSKKHSPGQIIFMRGYPSPEWVGHIGSKHRVDPEFFSRWLDFRVANDQSNNFSFPSLPSQSWNLLELPFMRIGIMKPKKRFTSQADLDAFRRDSVASLNHYKSSIQLYPSVGQSVIRNAFMLDGTHFAIEQKITICMQPQAEGKGWLLLVWTDWGDDLAECLLHEDHGLWNLMVNSPKPLGYTILPTITYRPDLGLSAHLLALKKSSDGTGGPSSTPLLDHNYGRSLRPEIMAQDQFYALTEIFQLAASAHKQFLNMIEQKLLGFTEESTKNLDGLANLTYIKSVLRQQIHGIQRVRLAVDNIRSPKWPEPGEVGKRARNALSQDYKVLLDQAEASKEHCQESITLLQSSIAILESKKAILQAQRVAKLTFLAFVFVPMSFTTSFFGMEFPELQGLHIWVWGAATLPIMVIVVVLFFCDVSRYWNILSQWCARRVTGLNLWD